jgi:hypothetical protein
MIRIRWTRCKTYDDAKDYIGVVYLHEWNGSPFYWGICNGSVFGGNTRQIDGMKRNPRYGSSYRHWIEGCLRHGGSLYVGVPEEKLNGKTLQEIENVLIVKYPTTMNSSSRTSSIRHEIKHEGDVPECIRKGGSGEHQL